MCIEVKQLIVWLLGDIVSDVLCVCHVGFWIAYESIRDELKDVIRLILDENPGVSVYVTGHSMGGALAVLAAYDLAVNFSIKVNMYNFGGPRVGNPSFRQHYDSFVPMSFRVVMDGDIAPGWPKFVRRRVYCSCVTSVVA